ncbi:MAG TPA: 2Fe-2S iron-sulfur cluster-binding protein [Gammaproteobacteria bacterium]|nr:2Fe-2S iron-sulfur cluster-binding protein [Gammaproteobacteria bacterium]
MRMSKLVYNDVSYERGKHESVLDALLRQGVNVPFSCRRGSCQVCLMRATAGDVPEDAQRGLRPELRALGYFLPCQCVPAGDFDAAPPRDADLYVKALVHDKERVAPDVVRLLLEVGFGFHYRAGQFVNLRPPGGPPRSYSLASLPEDYFLELHVKRMENGLVSGWIHDSVQIGEAVDIQGPQGANYYLSGDPTQPLLLVASGTGLAPLIGIARDALRAGHTGPMHLYHGAHEEQGLYRHDELKALARKYPQVQYIPCVSGPGGAPPEAAAGRAEDVAFERQPDLSGWRVYLAGPPEMVESGCGRAARAGAHPSQIHADPFEYRDLRQGGVSKVSLEDERRRDPPPDPELWAALDDGRLLLEILRDFYSRVYADPRLSPFFHGVTMQRPIEKQYLFLKQVFSGEPVYFGDRPRNAHHWMVISDDLFDYREELMMTCVREHGLPENLVRRWRAIEEIYRPDIVKSAPWTRRIGDIELPVEGFGEECLSAATICDGCQAEIDAGETVRYHLRLGTTYCRACSGDKPLAERR